MVKTYAEARVDIEKEHTIVSSIVDAIDFQRKGFGESLPLKGHYAGIIDMGRWALALTTDGVGSKVLIAHSVGKYDTIGIDCIAMNVNDLYCVGAEPIAFVDYLAIGGELVPEVASEIGVGLARGAELSNISIVGGETAMLPEIVTPFDLAGTCVGLVEKNSIIDGSNIEIGDALIGIPSSGLHSNGYTLARKLIEENDCSYNDPTPFAPDRSIGEVFLEPTRIYSEVLKVIKNCEVHGLAHITGGGITKLRRLTELGFQISSPLKPQPVFGWLQELGGVDEEEMFRTFNMGMGFMVVCPQKEVSTVLDIIKDAKVVGSIVEEGITVGSISME